MGEIRNEWKKHNYIKIHNLILGGLNFKLLNEGLQWSHLFIWHQVELWNEVVIVAEACVKVIFCTSCFYGV